MNEDARPTRTECERDDLGCPPPVITAEQALTMRLSDPWDALYEGPRAT